MTDLNDLVKNFTKIFPLASDVDPKQLPNSISNLNLGYYLNNENMLNRKSTPESYDSLYDQFTSEWRESIAV
jgi:hypothetical protein